ncbi:DUF2313 domain-containing protein [Pectobacterium versatile]|uniref:YmfQ family protein n=1 Tax=Pectobacterium versatile TaxID=2488639 RepID=UPI001B3A02AF|nr:putative phage tail protein [Pectobacterium versatile]MBQ4781946.1 DUF2313 domain-containing protein [Pectobacterium versatile]MBQ4786406.1 DUF2313 domain-containing protein [Pectobacterium versatile]
MAHSVEEWMDVLQQLMPVGKAWPRDVSADLNRVLKAFSRRLNRAESNADLLLAEMKPETTQLMIDDWERYLGLPECDVNNTFISRRDGIVEKFHRKGGLAAWQIEALAEKLGFSVSVEKILPHHCLRSCVFPLNPTRYRFLLKIYVRKIPNGRFTVLDTVLTPLINEQAAIIECVLNQYRLAGTGYEFIYEEV